MLSRIAKMKALFTLVLLMLTQTSASAQETRGGRLRDPFACLNIPAHLSPREIRRTLKSLLQGRGSEDAVSYCRIAELMKRVGDTRAESFYEKAIAADDAEPAYELFYADYLRNFRGAKRPLFARAERHYYQALRKSKQLKDKASWDVEARGRIERGRIALYQEDGLPLFYRGSDASADDGYAEQPYLFFSTTYRNARLTTDFESVDDARALTSEALFTSSRQRLNRALTADELEGIVREKGQFETYNRLRFRYRHLPAFDVFYKHRKINVAQITNFFAPNRFNDFRMNEVGFAVEKSFSALRHADVFLRGTYQKTFRKGLIEFLPERREEVNHFEARGAVSHFVGPDKVTLEAVYVFQDINPDIPNPPKRERRIAAATLTYQVFRPLPFLQSVYGKRFETRGLHLSGGAVRDTESFGGVDLRKRDYFFGAALRGLGRFDLSIQPTFFSASVTGDASQSHRHYRTNANLLYRIKDEEEELTVPEGATGLRMAFLHLVVPFKHDVALRGPAAFENVNVGAGLDAKFFSLGPRRTTFLASFRYNHQRFHNLRKNLNLYSLSLSMGF